MALPTTLTEFEATLLPSATPTLSRACATQGAGAALDCREQLARGITFSEAQGRVLRNPRHQTQLARWGLDSVFGALTGP